ncbi:MAG TPA: tripartite tricarboxylate transporter TctB family protein [Alphaproteobacteria bacterium]|nr:tripartite tricarboxylate transporter TctB family protein [Alphaproteobacteria bacterium]
MPLRGGVATAPRRPRVHADIAAALAISAVCVAAYAATYDFESVPEGIAQGMGPEAFPRLVLLIILGLCGLIGWQARAKPVEGGEPVPTMVTHTGFVLVGFMIANELVGMLPASFLFMIGLGWLWGERRLILLVASAGATVVVVWAVFARGFGIPFPAGLLGALWS